MRDPNRINRVLNTIRRVWHLLPDWRLGQLVCNLAREGGMWDSFYMEDDALESVAKRWLDEAKDTSGDNYFMLNKQTYPTLQDAVNAAINEHNGTNIQIHSNPDNTYDLIWETENQGDT